MNVDRDELIASLLEELLASSREGSLKRLEELALQYPDLATELRELWSTMQIAEELTCITDLLGGDGTLAQPAPTWTHEPQHSYGDYEIIGELGRGGMGIVYRARQRSLDRVVALKMILHGDSATNSDVARFRSEAESAARLQHPNIVNVYEVGDFEGRQFFSMKLIEGTTLAKRLLEGPLPSRLAAEMLAPVARAIADAHRRGVLHRDLKPSNILIDLEGRTYVTDFGLAKRFRSQDVSGVDSHDHLTMTGAILGTPSYMAPEQAAAGASEVYEAADIYSLGAILYAMLTGRPPFQGPSAIDTILMVREQDPLPPRMLNPKVDADLEMICLKCLQKPADLRYETADALADDLDAYLQSEPISARSSQFTKVISLAFRETHHAAVLENWGVLWMWHSLVVLLLCLITNWMHLRGVQSRWLYASIWTVGTSTWAYFFWELRRRSGPITFVERQIAHVWAGSVGSSFFLYWLEWILNFPVLKLSPVLALTAGNVFIAKAGILSGKFYIQAVALYITAVVMALMQLHPATDYGQALLGVVLGLSFFLPGWKYHRLRTETRSDR